MSASTITENETMQTVTTPAPTVDDMTDHAVRRISDMHACVSPGSETMTRDEVRSIISNAAYLMLVGAGMSHREAGEAMRGRYAFHAEEASASSTTIPTGA